MVHDKKSGTQWAAQITRGGVRTELGAYNEELTAAIVFQVVDKEYSKVGFPLSRIVTICAIYQKRIFYLSRFAAGLPGL